ncbi:MAG: aldo/keto reductase, partial [Sphingomonas bacterium]|nr:aldo/keto reductase [Sphingomonas bacterium]
MSLPSPNWAPAFAGVVSAEGCFRQDYFAPGIVAHIAPPHIPDAAGAVIFGKDILMRYNPLGRTGLFVSELCLGTMTFGSGGRFQAIAGLGQSEADALLKGAIDAGVNFIDTANVYSEGQSEELTGQAIRNLGLRREDVVLAT